MINPRKYYRPHHTLTPRRTLPYICKTCESVGKRARFETYEELQEHRKKKHSNPIRQLGPGQKFMCSICGKVIVKRYYIYEDGEFYHLKCYPSFKKLKKNPSKYEIKVDGKWSTVDRYIFRSWSGERRLNGVSYSGPVYYLGSRKTYKLPKRAMSKAESKKFLKGFEVNPVGLYQSFHGTPPLRKRPISFTVPKGNLVKIGRLKELQYEPEHPSKHLGIRYTHEFGDYGTVRFGKNHPILAVSKNGKQLYIINDKSKYNFESRGIVG